MRKRTTYSVFKEFFTLYEMWDQLRAWILVLKYGDKKVVEIPKKLLSLSRQLQWDQTEFEKAAKRFALDPQGKANKDIAALLSKHSDALRQEIIKIPNSLDKPRQALRALIDTEKDYDDFEPPQIYDALVLLGEELSEKSDQIVKRVVKGWKKSQKHHLRERYYSDFDSQIFWFNRTQLEDLDAVSKYRFKEYYVIDEFPEAFKEVEQFLERELVEAGETGWEFLGEDTLIYSGYLLWLIGRSRGLSNNLDDAINIVLRRLAKGELPESWNKYYSVVEKAKDGVEFEEIYKANTINRPTVYSMALSCLAFLKLSTDERIRHKGILGARWLLEHQNQDGSWSRQREQERGKYRLYPSFFATLIAIEVLVLSGLKTIQPHLDRAVDWLIKEQNEYGFWQDELKEGLGGRSTFPLDTVRALEIFDLVEAYRTANWRNPAYSRHKIFISYSRADWEQYVKPYCDRLRKAAYPVWLDQHLIEGGQDWLDEINTALKECQIMLLFLTPDALASRWVKMEYRYFIEKEKPILPIMCVDTELPAELMRIQWFPYEDFLPVSRKLNGLLKFS